MENAYKIILLFSNLRSVMFLLPFPLNDKVADKKDFGSQFCLNYHLNKLSTTPFREILELKVYVADSFDFFLPSVHKNNDGTIYPLTSFRLQAF